MNVITRIPPSPTGRLHIGTARTALYNYLFARNKGGKISFRSEDTDASRSKKEYEDEIIEGLHWLGLSWDKFSRQSERGARYAELLTQVIEKGHAYVSKEPAKDDPTRTVEVVRLKNPGRDVPFMDVIRGEINFHTGELGDFVIARSVTDALYHFAVVVDDIDDGITHVIRGEDHISNTARQILIQEALGAPRPIYAHLPLILDEKRAKLSKRSGTAVAIADYRAEGFMPEAMVNYFALLGWNPGTDREHFSLADLVDQFSLENLQKGGASWDRTKLLSVNQRWMRELSSDEYLQKLQEFAPETNDLPAETLARALPLLQERAQTFGEARDLLKGELSSLFASPEPLANVLEQKEPADRPGITKGLLESLLEPINGLSEGLSPAQVKEAIYPLAEAEEARGKGGRGALLWPLRYALSGLEKSPDPFTLISILGPKESRQRLQHAIGILG